MPPQKAVRDAKTRKTVADSERERSPQKTKREEEGAAEEEYFESYETPDNDSDSATTEKKKTKKQTKKGKITPAEEKILKTKFTSKGPALFGSVQNLKEESKISRSKVKRFLHTEPAYTKYRTVRRKTPRLKVIVYDIDEIWSIDLAYVDKLADYNKNIKYLMVAVDCMSRFLRVQPLKSKYATSTAEAFKHMIKTKQPKKVWVDKGREFKGSCQNFM